MNVLPVFNGWTVDFRCGQFRKVPLDDLPQFVSFKSDEGDELLAEYLDYLDSLDHALWEQAVSQIHF